MYWGAEIGLESNGSDGEVMLANTRLLLQTEWRIGLTRATGYESESHIGRFIGRNQFFMPYLGWDIRNRSEEENEKNMFGQVNTKMTGESSVLAFSTHCLSSSRQIFVLITQAS